MVGDRCSFICILAPLLGVSGFCSPSRVSRAVWLLYVSPGLWGSLSLDQWLASVSGPCVRGLCPGFSGGRCGPDNGTVSWYATVCGRDTGREAVGPASQLCGLCPGRSPWGARGSVSPGASRWSWCWAARMPVDPEGGACPAEPLPPAPARAARPGTAFAPPRTAHDGPVLCTCQSLAPLGHRGFRGVSRVGMSHRSRPVLADWWAVRADVPRGPLPR